MARQVAQKEAADARRKKRTREVRWKQEKEQEIARRVKAGERRSDVESELELGDPIDVDDMVFFEKEESREVVVTSAERRDPAAMSTGDVQESQDAPFAAPVGASRAEGHGDPQAGQEPVGTTPPPTEVRGHRS